MEGVTSWAIEGAGMGTAAMVMLWMASWVVAYSLVRVLLMIVPTAPGRRR